MGSLKLASEYALQGADWNGRSLRDLELVRDRGDDSVVSEEGVTVFRVIFQFGDAGRAVAIESPGAVDREDCPAEAVHDAGVERDDLAGAAEAVAAADQVAHGNAFAADADAECEAAHLRYALGDACSKEILVSDRVDALPRLRPKAGNAVGVHGIKEVLSLGVNIGAVPEGLVGLRAYDESPATVAGLQGGVCGGYDHLSLIECGSGGVVNARGDFECEADGDIATVLGGWTEDPGLSADGYVAEAADLIDTRRRIDLVAGAVVDGDVCDDAPAWGDTIFEADIKDVLVILDGGGPGDLVVADE